MNSCLSMGNPHVVQFVDDVARISLEHVARCAIRDESPVPERVNVSFATVLERNIIKMRVWERGMGATVACGLRVRSGGCRCGKWPVRPGYGYLRSFAWGRSWWCVMSKTAWYGSRATLPGTLRD